MSDKNREEFGKYKLVQKIGQEIMADIFKGEEVQTGKTVILKILSSAVSSNPLFSKFFGDRQTILSHQVEHPNILSVLDAGEIGTRHYVAIEYVEGQTLARRLREGKIPTEEGIEILRQLAEALRAMHQKQVTHGDIKPGNIILSRDRRNQLLVKLSFADLALSPLEATVSVFGEMLGSPKYMSPEQIKGRAPDARSDTYSLGVTAYEMFAGHAPFDCEKLVGYLYKNVHEDAIPLAQLGAGIPREVSVIVEKMMAKDPMDRYKTPQRLIEDIEQAGMRIIGQYVETTPPSEDSAFAPKAEKPAEKAVAPTRRVGRVAVVAAAVLLLGGGLAAGVAYRDPLIGFFTRLKNKAGVHGKAAVSPNVEEELAKAKREKRAASDLAKGREFELNAQAEEARRAYEKIIADYPDTQAAQDARSALTGLDARPPQKTTEEDIPTAETAQAFSRMVRQAKGDAEMGRYQEAVRSYKDFAERHAGTSLGTEARENIPYLLYSWAEKEMAKGQYDVALAKYAELKKDFPDNKWAREAEKEIPHAGYLWGAALLEKEQYNEAGEKLENVIQSYRNTEWGAQALEKMPEVIHRSAQVDLKKRDLDSCVAKLRELTIKYGKSEWGEKAAQELPKVLYDRSLAALKAGDTKQAETALRDIVENFPEAPAVEKARQKLIEIRQDICKQAFEKNNIEEGLDLYDQFAEANPGVNWKPVKDEDLEQYREMVKKYKPIAKEAGEKVTLALALYQAGLDLAGQGKVDQALEKHQVLIKEHPLSTWAQKAKLGMPKLMYDSATLTIRRGDVKLGSSVLNQLIKKFPGDDWAKKAQGDLRDLLNVPKGMVYVPEGDLIMGSTDDDITMAITGQDKYKKEDFLDETPRHVVHVKPFYVDLHEVTCAEYKKFVDDMKHEPPLNWLRGQPMRGRENHPVTMVRYESAEAYASWAGKRLPTEEEWEMAARGTDGRIFPWGNQYQDGTCNILAGKGIMTKAAGSYPAGASPYGCLDMVGNVEEWVAGWYSPYPGTKFKSPKFGETHRVARGGCWQTEVPAGARCATRRAVPAKSENVAEDYLTIGFRCAKTPE